MWFLSHRCISVYSSMHHFPRLVQRRLRAYNSCDCVQQLWKFIQNLSIFLIAFSACRYRIAARGLVARCSRNVKSLGARRRLPPLSRPQPRLTITTPPPSLSSSPSHLVNGQAIEGAVRRRGCHAPRHHLLLPRLFSYLF